MSSARLPILLSSHNSLQALVRLSTVIPLPTDEDIAEVGVENAGAFMSSLIGSSSPDELRTFLEGRRQRWDKAPRQKPWRCLEHLCSILQYTISGNLSKGEATFAAVSVTADAAMKFAKRRLLGIELTKLATISVMKTRPP